jgi:hypothetical protein
MNTAHNHEKELVTSTFGAAVAATALFFGAGRHRRLRPQQRRDRLRQR